MFALWQQLLHAIIRPPRDAYNEGELVGGERGSFRLALPGYPVGKYYRESVELTNPRGQKLVCSHYRCCLEGMRRPGTGDGGGSGDEVSTAPESNQPSPVVVYLHSNSGSQRDAEEILFNVLQYDISVFALDFAGSGLSDGEYVTLGAFEQHDVQTAVDYLRSLPSVSTIGMWGRSMGAVTALLYAHRDPSIAACVVDSPFSSLLDLMTEIATDQENGMGLPRSVVKMLLVFMKRAVRKRAAFRLEDVSPKDVVRDTFVPVLFGHGREDTFIGEWHSERLFERHGAEVKRVVTFEGHHNSVRPSYWYDVGMDFLISALFVEGQQSNGFANINGTEAVEERGVVEKEVELGREGRSPLSTNGGAGDGAGAGDSSVTGAAGVDERWTDAGRQVHADRTGPEHQTPKVAGVGEEDSEVVSLTPDDIAQRLERQAAKRVASPLPLRGN